LIKVVDIYNSIFKELKEKYPTYKIYGQEVTEGYETPSFFIAINPKSISYNTYHSKKCSYNIIITYNQQQLNDMDNKLKIDELQEIFGLNLYVLDRIFTITNTEFSYVGNENNVLQFSFQFEYMEKIIHEDSNEIMKQLTINNITESR
jgi:hypothetical protein